jgi:hypothetical protein
MFLTNTIVKVGGGINKTCEEGSFYEASWFLAAITSNKLLNTIILRK